MRNWNKEKGYRIYYNLHKHVFSIQAWDTDKGGWRLYQHSCQVYCCDVSFKVYENSRQKVLKEGKKNVHAFIIAKRIYTSNESIEKVQKLELEFKSAYYSPYSCSQFENADNGTQLSKADKVLLINNQIYYVDQN